MTTVRVHRWDEIALEKITEMISQKIVAGEREMLAQIYLKRGALVPMHSHESEQMTYILQGALRVLVGGEEIIVREGEVLHIPSGIAAPGRSARGHVRARRVQPGPAGLARDRAAEWRLPRGSRQRADPCAAALRVLGVRARLVLPVQRPRQGRRGSSTAAILDDRLDGWLENAPPSSSLVYRDPCCAGSAAVRAARPGCGAARRAPRLILGFWTRLAAFLALMMVANFHFARGMFHSGEFLHGRRRLSGGWGAARTGDRRLAAAIQPDQMTSHKSRSRMTSTSAL